MLENYKLNEDGVITQIERTPFKYNVDYSSNYNTYGEVGNYMSYLRLGNIIGALNKIPESILDVGYGNGSFLKACTQIIPNCFGHDISNYPLPSNCTFIENITDHEFDVVTFFDSLEHFNDIEFVQNIKTKYMVISVPLCHYKDDKWFMEWKHRKPDEHLWHFNESSLVKFMDRMGYKVITLTNIEDTIRKNKTDEANILTGIFKNESATK